jgi:oligo-1,6-glucosidase
VQWTPGPYAGFSTAEPWIQVSRNAEIISVQTDRAAGDRSIFEFYRRLIGLRHDLPVVALGEFALLEPTHPALYAFNRTLGDDRLLVLGNWSSERLRLPEGLADDAGMRLIGNYPEWPDAVLEPWEARVYRRSQRAGAEPVA